MLLMTLAAFVPVEAPIVPPVPPAAPPVTEQSEYLSELPRSGITPEMLRRPLQPKASLVTLFSTEDYPLQSIRNQEQGIVGVVLKIGVDGRVADCVIYQSSGYAALDWQTCRILWSRASFEPARNKAGRPAVSAWRQRIRWELPDPRPKPIKPWSIRLTLDFVEEGGVLACDIEAAGAIKENPDDCAFYLALSNRDLAKLRADAGYKQQRVVMDTELSRAGQAAAKPAPKGMKLSGRQVAGLTVDQSGKPLACRVIASEGSGPPIKSCDDLLDDSYEKPDIERGAVEVTITRTLYLPE